MRYAMNRIPWATAFCVLTSGLVGIAMPAKAESLVRGLVTAAGGGGSAASARVSLYDLGGHLAATTQADASGRYSFSEVAPGKYLVLARGGVQTAGSGPKVGGAADLKSNSLPLVAVSRIELGASSATAEENFSLSSSGGVIVGKVTETDGLTPVPNVPVSAYQPSDGSWVATALTWDDGVYFLVVPEGEYVLDARRPAAKLYGPVTYDGLPGTISEGNNLALATRVTLEEPNDIVFDKDFQLPRGTITVVSPNGGETWTAGSPVTVTWTTTAVPPDVSIWVLVRDGVSGAGALLAGSLLPRAGDGQCTVLPPTWLRDGSDYIVDLWLTDGIRFLGSDQSNAPFTVTGSTSTGMLEILSPSAGQPCWTAGTQQTISWTATEGDCVQAVLLDTQGMRASIGWVSSEESTLSWDIPSNIGNGADYRVLCLYDTGPSSASGDMFAPIALSPTFEICGSGPRPFLRTILPYAGQTWTAGAFENVCWESDDSTGYVAATFSKSISGYFDLTMSGAVTAGCAGNQICSYVADADDYRILAMLQTPDGLIVADESAGDFRIVGGQELTLTLTSPNGGESLSAGQTYPITWEPLNAGGQQVNISLARWTGETVAYIGQAPAEAGTFDWSICSYVEDAADYVIQLYLTYEYGCPSVMDRSNQSFSIAGGQASTLTLTSFNDGGEYAGGQTYPITWEAQNAAGRTVHVELRRRAEGCAPEPWPTDLGTAPAEAGQFNWTICPYGETASDFLIQISFDDEGCPTVSDVSDQRFTVRSNAPPTLELASPAGGEPWAVGTEQTITWITDATEGQVRIELRRGGGGWELGSAPAADGEFTWHVGPSAFPEGTDYTIRIRYELAGCPDLGVIDESGPFNITSASISGTVTDSAGSPLGGILVELLALPAGGGLYTSAYAVTDGNGVYTLVGVPPERYRLRAGGELEWGIEPAIQDPVGQHWYERVEFGTDYDNAQAQCQSRGGYLAAIGSAEENEWVWNNAANGWCLLGGTDRDGEGTWAWANGEPWVYDNWRDGEPNDCCLGEDYLVMEGPDGRWNDLAYFDGRFVCEYEQQPAPTANYARIYYPDDLYFNEADIVEVPESGQLVDINFVLPLGAAICGTVTERDSGTAIPDAHIGIWPYPWQRGTEPEFYGQTDQDGHYRIRHLPAPNRYEMAVEDGRHVPKCYNNRYEWEGCELVEIPAPQEMCGVDYTMEPGGCISGTVQIGDRGEPGVHVGASSHSLGVGQHTWTDESGKYSICGLPADDYTVSVQPHAPTFPDPPYYGFECYDDAIREDQCELVPLTQGGHVLDIDFGLDEAGCISGTVYDEETNDTLSGSPIGLEVWDGTEAHWTNLVLWTDSDGSYTAIARPETYLVSAHRPGYHLEYYGAVFDAPLATQIDVQLGPCVSDINIHLNRAYDIEGTVVDSATGQGIPGAVCHASPDPDIPGIGSGDETDEQGHLVIEGLIDHDYQVDCSAARYCPRTIPVLVSGANVTDLTIELDSTVAPDFDEDCDVDTDDYDHFETCASGPGIEQSDPGCTAARLDNDSDVDQADFSIFQRCLSGPEVRPTPGCDSRSECPLTVDVGEDRQACVGDTIQLTANTTCGVPPLAYSWVQTTGPAVTIPDPTIEPISVTFSGADVYTFVVTVTDAEGNNAADSISVQVDQCP